MENIPTWTPVVALALRDETGRWLFHKRPLNKQHGGLWEFPGGKVEQGENPANALIREIEEELGLILAASDLSPAGFAQSRPEDSESQIVIMLYTAARWAGQPENREGGDFGWFSPEEIGALSKPPLDVVLAKQLFAPEVFPQ